MAISKTAADPGLSASSSWVQLATLRARGGLAGRKLEFVDIADEILARLGNVDCVFETREVSVD